MNYVNLNNLDDFPYIPYEDRGNTKDYIWFRSQVHHIIQELDKYRELSGISASVEIDDEIDNLFIDVLKIKGK